MEYTLIGNRIRRARIFLDISMKELSHKSKITLKRLLLYETNKETPSEKEIKSIANSLNISLNYLKNGITDFNDENESTLYDCLVSILDCPLNDNHKNKLLKFAKNFCVFKSSISLESRLLLLNDFIINFFNKTK